MFPRSNDVGIDCLTEDVTDLLKRRSDQLALARGVDQILAQHLEQPDWLPARFQEPGESNYRQHLIYVSPCGRFSIVSLVWRPGQRTPIHDHVSWCVVGVYSGLERTTGYHLYEDAGGRFLVPTHTNIMGPRQTEVLVPPDEDIHQVSCAGDALTVSIHIYGADIEKLGSSVNRRFEDVEVQPADRAAVLSGRSRRLRWRDA